MYWMQHLVGGTDPMAKHLTPEQIKIKYRELAAIINTLESAGEDLTLWDTEHRTEIVGLTARVFKYSKYRGSWNVE